MCDNEMNSRSVTRQDELQIQMRNKLKREKITKRPFLFVSFFSRQELTEFQGHMERKDYEKEVVDL